MADNSYYNINNLVGNANSQTRKGGPTLPSPGNVVMAAVDEDNGDGTYTLKWGTNRLTVASKTALTKGETLILKSELSTEGKPILVVQGNALPNSRDPIPGLATYRPPAPTGSENAGTSIAASTTAADMPRPTPVGTTLLPILIELPDVEVATLELLLAAEEERQKNSEEAKQAEAEEEQRENRQNATKDGEKSPARQGGTLEQGKIVGETVTRPAAPGQQAQVAGPTTEGQPQTPEQAASPQQDGRQPAATPQQTTEGASRPATLEQQASVARPAAEGQKPVTSQQPQATENASQPVTLEQHAPAARPAAEGQQPAPNQQPQATEGQQPAANQQQQATENASQAQTTENAPRPAGPEQQAPSTRPALDGQPQTREQTSRPPQDTQPAVGQPQATENQPRPAVDANQSAAVQQPREQPTQPSSGPSQPVPVEAIADAIEQIANSSQMPLSQELSHLASTKIRAGVVPEAIADRAATILLNAAGLTPSPAALEAAKALISHNVQVDRQTIQTLMSMVAGLEGDERANLLNAAARLASHDVPLATPLAAGLADILSKKAGISELLSQLTDLLSPEGLPESAKPLLSTAKEMLEMLVVDLDKADAPLALERFISTFGRETLGKTLAMVETAAQALLENNPQLVKIDSAMTAILTMLEQGETPPAQGATPETLPGQTPPAATLPSGEIPEVMQPGTTLPPAQAATPETGQTATPGTNQPEQQPPTPGTQPGQPTQTGQAKPTEQLPLPGSKEFILAQESTLGKNQVAVELAENPLFSGKNAFQLPGVNSPDVELLRPSGALDRILASAEQQQGVGTNKDTVEKLLRELLGPDSHKAESALRDLSGRGKQTLASSASRLAEMERDIIRNDPVLTRLSDAAGTIRDLGRQLLAAKAENLATADRNPGVMMAEVPFKLNEDGGNGRMQMFYRRTKSAKGGWSARVILDLNTTSMGPVLGDMRFFGQDMVLNLFVDQKETAEFLAGSAEELTEALLGKGFRLKPKFMVLPPPELPAAQAQPAASERTAEPVEQKEPDRPTGSLEKGTGLRRRIDAKA